MASPWESREYQTIEAVSFGDGQLRVRFADGDEVELPVGGLLAREPTGLDWAAAEPHAQELLVPAREGTVDIPWTTLRSRTDPRFAEFLMTEADDDARRIGRRLRALREQRGMSSKEVAEAAGIAPMSLSRIELGRHDVVFRTLRRILAAMGYTLRDLAEVDEPAPRLSAVLSALRKMGVGRGVVDNLRAALGIDAQRLVGAAERIFGVSRDQLLSGKTPDVSPSLAGARFKTAVNQNPALATYTMWAHWLALLVDQACVRDPAEVPENPFAIREEVLARHGELRFKHLLEWCWDHDVAVLPLNDPGEFHGACWNVDGRVVVVLKQGVPWDSRWSFDLSHELGHVARHLHGKTTSVVELSEPNPAAPSDDDDEQEANDFAGELLLGDADALAQALVERTQRRLPRLKSEVVKLARESGVQADALANYMAHRLAVQGQDWWATATRLQEASVSAPELARDVLLTRIDWTRLANEDEALLRAALEWDGGKEDDG